MKYIALFPLILLWGCHYNRPLINNKIHGDGVTDDTAAFQRLIKQGNVSLPKNKTLLITSTIKIPSNTTLDGNGSSLLFRPNTKCNAIAIEAAQHVKIENLTIIGNTNTPLSKSTTGRNQNLFHINHSNNISIKNVRIKQHAFTTVYIGDTKNVTVIDCQFDKIGLPTNPKNYPYYSYDCIFIGGYKSTSNITIKNTSFSNIGTNNKVQLYDGDGIHIQSPKGKIIKNIKVIDCQFDFCAARGIKIQSGSDMVIKNCIFKNSSAGITIAMVDIVHDLQITKNTFSHCNRPFGTNSMTPLSANRINFSYNNINDSNYGIRTSGKSQFKDSKITHNKAQNLNTFFIDGLLTNSKISNNIITNYGLKQDKSLYMAMLIVGKSSNLDIVDNTISTTAKTKTAIYVQDATKNINITNNKVNIPLGNTKYNYIFYLHGADNLKALHSNKVKLE